MANAYNNSRYFDPKKDNEQSIASNYVIIKQSDQIYAALCRLQKRIGSSFGWPTVKNGDLIGRVGNSGNSFAPHLHFQLMDSSDIAVANDLPCVFENYELFKDGKWEKVTNGVPTNKDRIRFLPTK